MNFKFLTTAILFTFSLNASIPRKPFYCVRHCVTEWNLQQRSQGHTDIPLHPIGRKQAEKMRELCHTFPITHFWSSPLSRAWQTMQIFNEFLKLPEHIHQDLIERKMGALEGVTAEEWYKLDQETFDKNLEPKELVQARTQRVLNEILSYDGVPCIVTHSNIVRAILKLTNCHIEEINQEIFLYFEPTLEDAWQMTVFASHSK